MSLDDCIETVNSTAKALDTIASLSQNIIQNRFNYSDLDLSHALSYEKEFNKAVWTRQVTPDLREDFNYLCMIVVHKVRSPASGIFNLMVLSSVAGTAMGAFYKSGMVFLTSIAAGLFGWGLKKYHDRDAKRQLYMAAAKVNDGEDMVWEYALARLHKQRNTNSGELYG